MFIVNVYVDIENGIHKAEQYTFHSYRHALSFQKRVNFGDLKDKDRHANDPYHHTEQPISEEQL